MGSDPRVLPVLMYHSITTGEVRTDMQVRLPSLRRQLVALQQDGWQLTGLTDALSLKADNPLCRVVALTFDDGYADFLGALDCLSQLGAGATLYIPTFHVGSERLIPEAGRLLTWAELVSVAQGPVEIGSHSHHHRPMDVRPLSDIESELSLSRRLLEENLGITATSFCYPHGYSSRAVRRRVARSGYSNACIVGRRLASPGDDVLALPRLQMTEAAEESNMLEMMRSGDRSLSARVKPRIQGMWRGVRYLSKLAGHELT